MKDNNNNDTWIDLFLFFLVADKAETVADLIRSDNCEEKFTDIVQRIATMDSECFQCTCIDWFTKHREKLMELNKIYKTSQKEFKAPLKQTDDSYFDFDKVKENLKRDDLSDLVVDYTCEREQEQTRDEKMIDAIDFAIKATDSQDDYSMGMRNGMRYAKSLVDGKEPQCELRRTDEEIKFGIVVGDEVVSDYGAKGVVVGIDTYKGEIWLSLLMRNHKVPQFVKASSFKTKTSRHFPQIMEVLEQIKGEADGK